ncbi:hypothetical protein FN846DRAFT_909880 [Sphaerosporella brunnea]|uniref:Uncharacterized protein n=1 Tax=Sphaerosporella brunnea TaxID=1250544 RepID=A0A5J5EP99_9PEZI|nr:hypothetical protein FN846DRAFT_909880 [Sphaerosporella brunnea]
MERKKRATVPEDPEKRQKRTEARFTALKQHLAKEDEKIEGLEELRRRVRRERMLKEQAGRMHRSEEEDNMDIDLAGEKRKRDEWEAEQDQEIEAVEQKRRREMEANTTWNGHSNPAEDQEFEEFLAQFANPQSHTDGALGMGDFGLTGTADLSTLGTAEAFGTEEAFGTGAASGLGLDDPLTCSGDKLMSELFEGLGQPSDGQAISGNLTNSLLDSEDGSEWFNQFFESSSALGAEPSYFPNPAPEPHKSVPLSFTDEEINTLLYGKTAAASRQENTYASKTPVFPEHIDLPDISWNPPTSASPELPSKSAPDPRPRGSNRSSSIPDSVDPRNKRSSSVTSHPDDSRSKRSSSVISRPDDSEEFDAHYRSRIASHGLTPSEGRAKTPKFKLRRQNKGRRRSDMSFADRYQERLVAAGLDVPPPLKPEEQAVEDRWKARMERLRLEAEQRAAVEASQRGVNDSQPSHAARMEPVQVEGLGATGGRPGPPPLATIAEESEGSGQQASMANAVACHAVAAAAQPMTAVNNPLGAQDVPHHSRHGVLDVDAALNELQQIFGPDDTDPTGELFASVEDLEKWIEKLNNGGWNRDEDDGVMNNPDPSDQNMENSGQ